MKTALVSVTDKTGIAAFCKELEKLDFQIISTGGTLRVIREEGVKALSVDEWTGFPEILDGRVKTLHPKVHGGLLYKRDSKEHCQTVQEVGIQGIDIVVVNLYDFEGTLKSGKSHEDIIENIDIGGPSMLRSAAKNYRDVLVITDPSDYEKVAEALKKGCVSENMRRRLAGKAFSATAYYDAMISRYFTALEGENFPDKLTLGFLREEELRYGENPHQRAAVYSDPLSEAILGKYEQIHGKELSFNNLHDLSAAAALASEFSSAAAVAVKHATPCGAAVGENACEAFRKAYEGDPTSIFGGIIAINREVDEKTALLMSEIFLEVIAAPSFSEKALEILRQKKNLRLLILDFGKKTSDFEMKFINGRLLVQDADRGEEEELRVVTAKKPTEREMEDLRFAMTVCKHVKSNAVVIAKDGGTLAIGGGQTARIWALRNAVENAEGKDFTSSVLASDAFFPFDDCVRFAGEKGISAIMQPGGAAKDGDSIAACDELGLSMVFTGIRHFKH